MKNPFVLILITLAALLMRAAPAQNPESVFAKASHPVLDGTAVDTPAQQILGTLGTTKLTLGYSGDRYTPADDLALSAGQMTIPRGHDLLRCRRADQYACLSAALRPDHVEHRIHRPKQVGSLLVIHRDQPRHPNQWEFGGCNWGTASYPVTITNGTNQSVTITPASGNLFFRLKQ